MGLKHSIAKRANALLKPAGLRIVSDRDAEKLAALAKKKKPVKKPGFTLDEALARTKAHGLLVNTIIDVGASNGIWSERALKQFPDAKFLLVEALQEREEELRQLVQRHSNFDYVLAAAGEQQGETTFTVSGDLDGSGVGGGPGAENRTVPVTTLDIEVEKRGLPPPYFIKLDTHGFEVPILNGSRACLEKTAVLMIEVYNFKVSPWSLRFHEMCAHLDGLGFRCFDMVNPMLRAKDDCLWQMDLLFARSDAEVFKYEHYR